MLPAFAIILSRAVIAALAAEDVLLAAALTRFEPEVDGTGAFHAAPELARRLAHVADEAHAPLVQETFDAAGRLLRHAYALAVGFDALASVACPGLAADRLRAARTRLPPVGDRPC